MRPGRALRRWSADHRRLALIAGAAVGVSIAVAALAAVDLWRIRNDVVAGRAALAGLELDRAGDIAAVAEQAADRLEGADRRARRSPWLRVASVLPVAGDQVDGVRDLTGAASALGDTARGVGDRLGLAIDAADDGAGRLALTDALLEELDEVTAALEAIELPDRGLAGPVASARRALLDEVDEALGEIVDGRRRVAAVRQLLTGPGDYLVLGANNAEMSGGVGMPLTAGVLHIENGELEMGEFVRTGDLLPADGRGLPIGEDQHRLYDVQGFGYDFRGTTATPDFPRIGQLLVDMSARVATGPVDGVFLLDTIAVSQLVDAVGGVIIDGEQVGGRAVAFDLLIGNYLRFADTAARPERMERQSLYADAVFEALTSGDTDPGSVMAALQDLAAGRHLLAWSPVPELQEVWQAAGADGALGPRSLAVSVENLDASKVDPYVQPAVYIGTESLADGSTAVGITVDIHNPPLPDATRYQIGPTPAFYRSFIDLHLPGAATDVEVVEGELHAQGRDGDAVVVTSITYAPRNDRARFAIRFALPQGYDALEVVPSARVLGTRYDVNGRVYGDAVAVTIPLDRPVSGLSGAGRVAAVIAGVLVIATVAAAVVSIRRGYASVMAPRSAPVARRAYLARTPEV